MVLAEELVSFFLSTFDDPFFIAQSFLGVEQPSESGALLFVDVKLRKDIVAVRLASPGLLFS